MRRLSPALVLLVALPAAAAGAPVPDAWLAWGPAQWSWSPSLSPTNHGGSTYEEPLSCEGPMDARAFGPLPAGEHEGSFLVEIRAESDAPGCDALRFTYHLPVSPLDGEEHILRCDEQDCASLRFGHAADGSRMLMLHEWVGEWEHRLTLDLAAPIQEVGSRGASGLV